MSSALSLPAFTILSWFVRVCLNSSTRIAASARQLFLLCGVVALVGALSTGRRASGPNTARVRVRVSSPRIINWLTPSNATSLHRTKRGRAGQEVARQRGVSVSALLVPITATRLRTAKKGMPCRALVAKEQFAIPVTHITSPVLSNEACSRLGGLLCPKTLD
jgi:hypothetical protein